MRAASPSTSCTNNRLDEEFSLGHQNRVSTDANRGDGSVCLVGLDVEEAGTSHLEALFDAPLQRAVRALVPIREIAGKAGARAAGCGILRNTDRRREHASPVV